MIEKPLPLTSFEREQRDTVIDRNIRADKKSIYASIFLSPLLAIYFVHGDGSRSVGKIVSDMLSGRDLMTWTFVLVMMFGVWAVMSFRIKEFEKDRLNDMKITFDATFESNFLTHFARSGKRQEMSFKKQEGETCIVQRQFYTDLKEFDDLKKTLRSKDTVRITKVEKGNICLRIEKIAIDPKLGGVYPH